MARMVSSCPIMVAGNSMESRRARAPPTDCRCLGSEFPVLADGGVRSGLDVVRMLALGAKFVLLGRAWAYALAAEARAGVAHVLKLIEAEMRVAMALTGPLSVAELDHTMLELTQSGDLLKGRRFFVPE